MINKAILVGHLGADPDLKTTTNGISVSNFTLATSETWKDKNGVKQEKTEWHRIVLFDKLADLSVNYLSKGSKIYLEGKIQTRQWDDKDGNKRYATEIVAREIKFLSSRNTSGGPNGEYEEPPMSEPVGDNIPF